MLCVDLSCHAYVKLRCSLPSPVLQLTSQHPYAEVFIGRPHVWTVDLNNREEVEDAVKAILNQKVTAFFLFFFPLPAFDLCPGTHVEHCSPLLSVNRADHSLARASGLRISRRLWEIQNSWWQMWAWVSDPADRPSRLLGPARGVKRAA